MYPLVRWNEINVSQNASILVEDTLKEYFGDSGNIRKIQMCSEGKPEPYTEISVTKYGLFSKELSAQYPDDIISSSAEEYLRIMNTISGITVVENVNETLCIDDITDIEFSGQQIKDFLIILYRMELITVSCLIDI